MRQSAEEHRVDAHQVALRGLTSDEVARRVAEGKSNVNTDVRTKTIPQILAEHTLTLFNLVNLVLAALVMLTGRYRNMLFLVIVAANLVVGVVQEVRAKLTIDKLTILTSRDVTVIRDGARTQVRTSDLVEDDLVCLSHGDQVPADARIVEGVVQMDESLLTGESVPVQKRPGDDIMSGSFLDSGSLVARVTRVGAEGYAARINAEAKYVKAVHSEIRDTLSMVIGFSTMVMPLLGVGLFLTSMLVEHMPWDSAVLSVVAALVSMIPQGLMLLTSSVLAIATVRLGRRNVLVQQPYCVETLARVDTVCLDKTGTITTGHMEVRRVEELGEDGRALWAAAAVARAGHADANDTSLAIEAYAEEEGVPEAGVTRYVPFSSEHKYSGCVTTDGRALAMGAGQFLMGERFGELADRVRACGDTARVLVVGTVDGFDAQGGIVGEFEPWGLVTLADELRPTARPTMDYFARQGVDVRVISGDDPATVSAIARRAGVPHADDYVDASCLRTSEELAEAARTRHVFGRVTPQQKRGLVRALREQGHTVAMTGDGVNDILALKEADCSIAMASGSAAARNVAEIVLADDDFSHLPEVVAEGRRSINNLQRSASLFLVKTIYSMVLCLVCIFFPPYPFLPIQVSFLSGVIIGYPSFALALEPNHERIRGNFLVNVLARALPASVAIVVALSVTMALEPVLGFTFDQTSTLCLWLSCLVGVALIYRISQPLTPLRVFLIASIVVAVVGGSWLFGNFFLIAAPTPVMALYLLLAGAGSLALFFVLYSTLQSDAASEGHLSAFVGKAEAFYDRHRSTGAVRRSR